MSIVTLAGGSGSLGQVIEKALTSVGHEVYILTRSPKKANHVGWNIEQGTIAFDRIQNTQILINLCGAGIADGHWTTARKKELLDSRILPTNLLFRYFQSSTILELYISASGVNCYPLGVNKTFSETDYFGADFVSDLVQKWELAADQFEQITKVYKLRMAAVLHPSFGILAKLNTAINWGFGAAVGKGDQAFMWVHSQDIARFCLFIIIDKPTSGAYNLCGIPTTNYQFMKALTKKRKKSFFMPNIPSFVAQLLFGEMAILFTQGVLASNQKAKNEGFRFQFETLEDSLDNIYD